MSNKVCVPNKTEDSNLSVSEKKNESKTLTKHISCESKCKFDGRKVIQTKSAIIINVDPGVKTYLWKDYIWNPATCSCKLLTIQWLNVIKL